MYKVIAHSSIYKDIYKFWLLYRDIFIDRFTDTWLGFAEEIIKSQYIESAELLVDTIIDGMVSILSRDFIYYTPLESGMRETSFRMGNRRIFLTYEEDETTQARSIVDIEILRK